MNQYHSIIVGSGVTGLSLAYHLVNQGKTSVLVLDDRPHYRASIANAGFLTKGSFQYYIKLKNEFGYKTMRVVFEKAQENVNLVKELIENLNLLKKAEWRYEGSVTCFSRELSLENVQLAKSLNMRDLGTRSVFDPHEGSFLPLPFMVALKQYLEKRGVAFSKERYLARKGHCVKTSSELLETEHLFLATNSLPGEIVRNRAQMISINGNLDKLENYNYYFPDDRIYLRKTCREIWIGGLRFLDQQTEKTDQLGENSKITEALLDFYKRQFDSRATVSRKWSGIMGMRNEELPLVQSNELESFIGGFSGHGNGFAFVLARDLVHEVLTKESRVHPVFKGRP